MTPDADLVLIDVERFVRETDRALCIRPKDFEEDVWLPTSQIDTREADYVLIPRWLAERKGLVETT